MKIDVAQVPLEEILPLRELYRQEMNCQIVHDSLPERGFGNLYLLHSRWPRRGLRVCDGLSRRTEGHDPRATSTWRWTRFPPARLRQLSDPGVEAGVLRDGQDSRRAVQRHEYSLAGDASNGRTAAMRPHFERYRSGEV